MSDNRYFRAAMLALLAILVLEVMEEDHKIEVEENDHWCQMIEEGVWFSDEDEYKQRCADRSA